MRLALVLATLTGCNQVLGLNATALIDSAGEADALPPNCEVLVFQDDQDTYLLNGLPHGLEDAVLVDDVHPGLIRFVVGSPTGTVTAAILHVFVADRADACGAGCGLCTNTATSYRLYWSESSWSDNDANSTIRRIGSPWDAELASGAGDRSAQIATHPLPGLTGEIDLTARMSDLAIAVPAADWIRNAAQLSFQILTDAPLAIVSDDRSSGSCLDGLSEPRLSLTVCR